MKVLDRGKDPRLWTTQVKCCDGWEDSDGCGGIFEVDFDDIWLSSNDIEGLRSIDFPDIADYNRPYFKKVVKWVDKRTASFKCPQCNCKNTIVISENLFCYLYSIPEKKKVF